MRIIRPMLKAIVFDFDGVLCDSEPLHYQAFLRVMTTVGKRFTYRDYLERYVGYDDRDALRVMLEEAERHEARDSATIAAWVKKKGDAFAEIVAKGAESFPGTLDFVRHAGATMPLAIASGATRRDIDLILAGMGVAGLFDVIVTADDVRHSKPDPETYRLAVEKLAAKHPSLGLTPAQCLAIEDTAAGLESARVGGLRTLALTTTSTADELPAEHVLAGLQGLTLARLHALYGS